MRQRITVEQLNELIDEQKQKLREWWDKVEPQKYDVFYGFGEVGVIDCVCEGQKDAPAVIMVCGYAASCTTGTLLPLLSIGQMIEIIGMDRIPYEIWESCTNEELCDALFDAVKAVL